jgi:hypothetical protein
MANQQNGALSEEAHRLVVVHIKLSTRVHNILKAVLSLEGSTMQAYFAAQAETKIAGASRSTLGSAEQTLPTPSPPPVLVPGQTYRMPTGRYMHWCVVCGNLWRSRKAQPVYCGHRSCHSLYWRTGKNPGVETPSVEEASEASPSSPHAKRRQETPVA